MIITLKQERVLWKDFLNSQVLKEYFDKANLNTSFFDILANFGEKQNTDPMC